jgi:hypothetical protein
MRPSRWLVTTLVVAGLAGTLGFRSPHRVPLTLLTEELSDILPDPSAPRKLLATSERELFLREENQNWSRVFSLESGAGPIRRLAAHPLLLEKVFLLTEEGALEINLKTKRAKWIFREKSRSKNRFYSLALHPEEPEQIYLGTEQGLFTSRDGGRTWASPVRWPENEPVELISFLPTEPAILLLGTREELFFSQDDGLSFESGFSLPLQTSEREEKLEEAEEISEVLPSLLRFTSVAFSPKQGPALWVGTRNGVYESGDGGISWTKLPDRGLENSGVRDLLFSERSGLVAATEKEAARFLPNERRWEALPLGLTEPPAALALAPSGEGAAEKLLVASGNEVFEWVFEPGEVFQAAQLLPSPERLILFQRLVSLEPTVREIQKAATRYADVGNAKIKRWHWGSRLRAFVPKLAFGKSFSVGRDSNIDIDRGGTNTPDLFIRGPEEIGLDRGWDLDLTWELGDFLYSSAQTSIDSRSKLLVELRESILSQVTRVYFERRRVQWEILLADPAEGFQVRLDRELRLEELTAQLDSLTNGFLSKKLEKLYEQEPELRELWAASLEEFTS